MSSPKHIQMGKHRLKLTNLDKVLYPEANVIKAEVIQYYLAVAPHLLRHVKHRPLSFIRYPDGIHGESFYQKNRPNHTPEWISSVNLGEDKRINYLMATSEASLVWMANMACIEFHQMSIKSPKVASADDVMAAADLGRTMPPKSTWFAPKLPSGLVIRPRDRG